MSDDAFSQQGDTEVRALVSKTGPHPKDWNCCIALSLMCNFMSRGVHSLDRISDDNTMRNSPVKFQCEEIRLHDGSERMNVTAREKMDI